MIAIVADARHSVLRYQSRMAGKPQFDMSAGSPRNQWLREALIAAQKRNPRYTQKELAHDLTRSLGKDYSVHKVSRMMKEQVITVEEMVAASDIMSHPLPAGVPLDTSPDTVLLLADIESLEGEGIPAREAVRQVLQILKIARGAGKT